MKTASLNTIVDLFRNRRFAEAGSQCRSFLRQHPNNGQALLLSSAIAQNLGDSSAALAGLRQAAAAFKQQPDRLLDVVVALQRIGALADAAEVLSGLDDSNPQVWQLKAQNAWRAGRYAVALDLFRTAVQRWPGEIAALHACARAEIRSGHQDEAEQLLNMALSQHPQDSTLIRLWVTLLLDQQRFEQARRAAARLSGEDSAQQLLQAILNQQLPQKLDALARQTADPRSAAIMESHDWLQQQGAKPLWFGSSTGLLRWAAQQSPATGVVVECGVFHGLSINLLARHTPSEIHGFDSFSGLPEAWKDGEPAGSYSTRGIIPDVAAQVTLHPGWFEDSLPAFVRQLDRPIALLHVDCDIYSSTVTVLQQLAPRLMPGSLLVFDDFLGYPGYQQHEFKAAKEYFASCRERFTLVAAVAVGRSVAFRLEVKEPRA